MKNFIPSELIKIELYKKIFSPEHNHSYIAVPEVSIAGNVADILVTNGDIHVYEIKSKTDSLTRLPKQIETFKKYANKVTVVSHEKFISKLIEKDYMTDVGIIAVNDNNKLTPIREAVERILPAANYFAYFNTTELRETLRGFQGWYKMTFLEAEEKILNILNNDEIRRLTLFRIKEKYSKESSKRHLLIKEKKYSEALLTRFEHMEGVNITPLREIPYCIFRDFEHQI